MVDWWLLLTILMPLIQLLFQTLTLYWYQKSTLNKENNYQFRLKTIKIMGKHVMPMLFGLFAVGFVCFGLYLKYFN